MSIKTNEKIKRLHVIEPQTFVKFALFLLFLLKLVQIFHLNNYTSDLNSNNLTRLARSKFPAAVLFKWSENCIHNGMNYATLKDLTDWLTNYPRACKNLDIISHASRPFTEIKDWKNNQTKIFRKNCVTASIPKKKE